MCFLRVKDCEPTDSCLTGWIGFQPVVSILPVFIEIVKVPKQTGMFGTSVMEQGSLLFF